MLIASTRLGDPNFARTVVLVVRHNESGAMGLVLNRPLEISVKEACREVMEGECGIEAHLYHGGPCPGPLMAIHQSPGGDVEVIDGIYFTTEKAGMEPLLRDAQTSARFFVGYAGWSQGQLEGELDEQVWLVTPALSRHIFEISDARRLWRRVMAELTVGQWIDPARLPEDPSLN